MVAHGYQQDAVAPLLGGAHRNSRRLMPWPEAPSHKCRDNKSHGYDGGDPARRQERGPPVRKRIPPAGLDGFTDEAGLESPPYFSPIVILALRSRSHIPSAEQGR